MIDWREKAMRVRMITKSLRIITMSDALSRQHAQAQYAHQESDQLSHLTLMHYYTLVLLLLLLRLLSLARTSAMSAPGK